MSKLANLKKLTSRHKKMITALVLDGRKQSEIAKEFGISQTRLPQLKRDPLWAAEESALVERYRSECISKIQLLVPDAIEALADSIRPLRRDGTQNDGKTKIAASKQVIDQLKVSIEKP